MMDCIKVNISEVVPGDVLVYEETGLWLVVAKRYCGLNMIEIVYLCPADSRRAKGILTVTYETRDLDVGGYPVRFLKHIKHTGQYACGNPSRES